MSYSVTQNTSFLTAASILQKIVSFVYFIIIARAVGVENTGQYFFAIAFTTIFTVVAEFGLATVLTRELSKNPENSNRYLNSVLNIKLFSGLLSYLLVVVAANALGYPLATKHLIYVSGVTMLFDNLQTAFFSVFRARRNLVYESIGTVGAQAATFIIGSVSLLLKWPLYWLILAYTIPSCLLTIYGAICARRVYGIVYTLRSDKEAIKLFLSLALPFALAAIIGRLYAYSDSLLMSKMLTPQEMGWWSVPYKIAFAFQFIPAALAASVYPAMSAAFVKDRNRIGELFIKSWRYLLVFVFPLALGLGVIARSAIVSIYGANYAPAAPVLQILLVSLIFSYLSYINGSLLNATNNQNKQTILLAVGLFSNIILNLILLPRWGIVGAAMAALISNILIWAGGWYYASRITLVDNRQILLAAGRNLLAAGLMAAMVWFICLKFGLIAAIAGGVAIYTVLVWGLKVVEVEMIRQNFKKIFNFTDAV